MQNPLFLPATAVHIRASSPAAATLASPWLRHYIHVTVADATVKSLDSIFLVPISFPRPVATQARGTFFHFFQNTYFCICVLITLYNHLLVISYIREVGFYISDRLLAADWYKCGSQLLCLE